MPRVTSTKWTFWGLHAAGVGLLTIAAATVYFFVIAPKSARFQANESKRVELELLMDRGAKLRGEFDLHKQTLEKRRSQQKRFQEKLPDSAQEDEFLAQVARLARSVDLAVRDYRPGEVTSRGNYSELEIELSCEGSYESICRFLDGLPSLPRLSSLTGIEVQSQMEQSVYPIRLNLSAYFMPMKPEERS